MSNQLLRNQEHQQNLNMIICSKDVKFKLTVFDGYTVIIRSLSNE